MRAESGLTGKGAEVETVTAAGIQNDVVLRRGDDLRNPSEQGCGDAAIVQSPARRNGRNGVARLIRSPILRLEQIDVSAAGDVEAMPSRTKHLSLVAGQGQAAIADGTHQHASSVADEIAWVRTLVAYLSHSISNTRSILPKGATREAHHALRAALNMGF